MGAKPSTLPRWANVGGAIVVPSSGKLDVGWVSAERPPAQYLNWYQNLVYLWVVFLDAFFTNGGAATGAIDLGNAAEATITPLVTWRDYNQKRRAVIDHNGYRMGQVSEIDECWDLRPITVTLPLAAGIITAGAPTMPSKGQWKFTAASQEVTIPISGIVPEGALITNVVVYYVRTTGTDNFQMVVEVADIDTGDGTATSVGLTTINSGTGAASVDLFAAGGPFFLAMGNPSTQLGHTSLRITTSAVTTADWITEVEVTYVVPPYGWTPKYTTTTLGTKIGGDQIAYVDPDANINQRSMKIIGQVLGGVTSSMELFGPFECFHNSDCAYAMEFMLRTGTISDASNARLFAAGIQNNNAGALNRFIYLFNSGTTANWQLRVVGSSTADTDTGVAIAANTTYRVRLEIYGTSVNSSGNTKIRLYINGTKVAEVNSSTLPAADMIRPYFKAGTTGGAGGPYDFRVGRVRRCWNHLLTSDNL